jgi:hypothetical protein
MIKVIQQFADRGFLGLRTWDYQTCLDPSVTINCNDGITLGYQIWTIVANIAYDLLVVAGIITVFVMVFGGFTYMTSTGNADKASKGQNTMIGGMIGAIISISASAIVGFLADNLTKGSAVDAYGQLTNVSDGSGLVMGALNTLYFIVGAVAVIMIIYSGFLYTAARGKDENVKRAKTSLTYAVAGFAMALMAYAITNFVLGGLFK